MREKLIESLRNIDYIFDNNKSTMRAMIEFTADYLLQNGVVVLPCKVGDVVYTAYDGSLSKYQVVELMQNDFWWAVLKNPIYVPEHQNKKICLDFSLGKTVFLTREEAEKALKEQGGE